MNSKLQIAIDLADTEKLIQLADLVHDVVDIIEVGTPVMLREGGHAVRALKEKYPDLCVLADAKIADAGALECRDCCEAGADIITVMAFSDDATIQEVADTAHKYGRKAMADLLCIKNIGERAKELLELGIDYITVHTGVDMQKKGRTPLEDLRELVASIPACKTAVAGGVSMKSLPDYLKLKPGIVIAGGSLYQAEDVRKAAMEMRDFILNEETEYKDE